MTLAKTPIDVFAHVLAPQFYQKMLQLAPAIPQQLPYLQNRALTDFTYRQAQQTVATRQIISMVNVNPEDYVDPKQAFDLCWAANQELADLVRTHPDQFMGAVAMVPMNNLAGAQRILTEQVATVPELLGVQVFTRALGQSIAAPAYQPLFTVAAQLGLPIWLHPIFDDRKPDNNVTFSWEYELTQAMLQLVTGGLFQRHPDLKLIVHHAGAMVPFFAGRIAATLPPQQAADFHRFYVDTAILGNPAALALTVDYFGVDHVMFGTDAPFGTLPVGASAAILAAIDQMALTPDQKQRILTQNADSLIKKGRF